ncbi:MAG TPA: mechanosensitive ion channel family protein, partial [Terrimesophilobacter sp.]|nr:mechanosensitive ion channel family protein [Terrimesophilobacter sp.]
WRERMPSIFIDVVRFLVIVVSIAVLFSWVWGADVGGLFTALGIGSIVIGLALQNAVGSVLAGLLLLFEQPFQLGDWLDVGGVRGRVEEVNWRAVHIRTVSGLQIIPNSELAGSGFTNLSRKTSHYNASTVVRFTTDDPPHRVMEVLREVAGDLPQLAEGGEPDAAPLTKARYEVDIPVNSPGDEYGTLAEFRTRLWYAARRAGLHLDRDLETEYDTHERRIAMLTEFGPILRCSPERALSLASGVQLHQFVRGERLQRPGEPPRGVHVIIDGQASMVVEVKNGAQLYVTELVRGHIVGLTSLTRQGINASVVARSLVSCLFVPVEVLDELVDELPELARDFGLEIDNRRSLVLKAFAEAGMVAPEGSRVIAY